MSYDPSKHFEVIFHIMGDRAKVINFRNFPVWSDLDGIIDKNAQKRYYEEGVCCIFYPQTSSNIPMLQVAVFPKGEVNTIYLWKTTSLDFMKKIQGMVQQANDRMDAFIWAANKAKENNREER
jgi:hypothetical protein